MKHEILEAYTQSHLIILQDGRSIIHNALEDAVNAQRSKMTDKAAYGLILQLEQQEA